MFIVTFHVPSKEATPLSEPDDFRNDARFDAENEARASREAAEKEREALDEVDEYPSSEEEEAEEASWILRQDEEYFKDRED
jgi:hypothetical protein